MVRHPSQPGLLPLTPITPHTGHITLQSDPIVQSSRTEARFSTYSGAPSLQPSLAPTYETSSSCSSTQPSTGRRSQASTMDNPSHNRHMSEKMQVYGSGQRASFESSSTLNSADPKTADIKSWSGALERMQDKRLDEQRYIMGENKTEEVSKLALGAKVDRALSRRMVSQDATFSGKKSLDEGKRAWEVEAN